VVQATSKNRLLRRRPASTFPASLESDAVPVVGRRKVKLMCSTCSKTFDTREELRAHRELGNAEHFLKKKLRKAYNVPQESAKTNKDRPFGCADKSGNVDQQEDATTIACLTTTAQ